MRKILTLLVVSFCLSSCGTTALYYWGGQANGTTKYEALAYKHYDKQTPESICKLICVYEDMVNNPIGTRKVPPPGICAEYAYLISQPEIVATFIENATTTQKRMFNTDNFEIYFSERAPELFEKEMTLYPESVTFIKPLFEKISKR